MWLIRFSAGDAVRVRDAFAQWHDAVALSDVEGVWTVDDQGRRHKIHDFPVVWVRVGGWERVPWPAVDVRPRAVLTQPTDPGDAVVDDCGGATIADCSDLALCRKHGRLWSQPGVSE